MSNETKVTKIVIQIGDDELSLSPDAARELLQVLQSLLGEKEPEVKYVPYPVDRPVYPYRYWYPTWSFGSTEITVSYKADNSLLTSWSGDGS
jgi:hypothetical protein